MHQFEYAIPETMDEVFALLAQHGDGARLLAGGTALVILMKQRLVQPALLVSLARIAELQGIAADAAGHVRIGARATHTAVETSPVVRALHPVLSDTIHHVATVRIRNVGTLGGNLAHADPNQDPPATLIALDASVDLQSATGTRRVPVEKFFTDYYETAIRPGEVLSAINIPPAPARSVALYHKFLPRTADDYATVAVAVRVTFDADGQACDDVRIALGAVGSTPIRARQAEAILRGQPLTDETIRAAAATVLDAVSPIADIRGSADYKRDMTEVWTRRILTRIAAQPHPA